jgi:hypothetical protein
MRLNDSYQFDALWEQIDREAAEQKFSHQAVMEISRLYRGWDAESQRVARPAFGRWLHSDNARKRFDALALIREFRVSEATRDLQELRVRLEGETGPEAAFELRKVNEVLGDLSNEG